MAKFNYYRVDHCTIYLLMSIDSSKQQQQPQQQKHQPIVRTSDRVPVLRIFFISTFIATQATTIANATNNVVGI